MAEGSVVPEDKKLIRQPTLCAWLDISRCGLSNLKAKDPTFPRPIKDGTSRQSAVFYVVEEVERWIAGRAAARDAEAGTSTRGV